MKIVEQGNFTVLFLNLVSVVSTVIFAFIVYCNVGIFLNRLAYGVVIIIYGAVGLCWQARTCKFCVFRDDYNYEFKINILGKKLK